jgi:hypothetical protein
MNTYERAPRYTLEDHGATLLLKMARGEPGNINDEVVTRYAAYILVEMRKFNLTN